MSLSNAKLAALVAFAVAGALAGYVMIARAPQSPWTAGVILGPMVVLTTAWLWTQRHRWTALAIVGLAIGLLLLLAAGRIDPQWVYVVQHAGIHAALAAWFASTLASTPLIVRVARRVHRLTPSMVAYATKVTQAWVVYFVVMALASVVIFATAPFTAWNVFATVLTPLSLLTMFVGEYKLRYMLNPDFERVSMRAAIRAWREPSRLPDDAPN